MNRCHLLFCCLLIIRTSYTVPDAAPTTTFLSSVSSFSTTSSTTPQSPPDSTPDAESFLPPEPETTAPPDPSLPQQTQTRPVLSPKQTQRPPRLSQEKRGRGTFKFPAHMERDDSDARERQVAAAGGVEITLMEPKDRLLMGVSQGAGIHAMGLFLGGCSLLLCLFIGIYCIYTCGAKKEPFSHHRLYNEGLDDPALFLDNPKDYDWFFYETDGYVYPTPCQSHPQPIQTLSVPALKQPPPTLEMSPEKPETSEAAPDTKPPLPKLECLSPANLHAGNFI